METAANTIKATDELAKAYYSIVIESTADEIWAVIRDFNEYRWAGTIINSWSDNGKAGDIAGAVRVVQSGDDLSKQVLTAHSDADRFYSYAFYDTPVPVQNYQATIRVTPTEESNNAYVEWSATFNCARDEQAHWVRYYTDNMIAGLNALNERLIKGK